jgi:hypothetical protein
MFSFGAHPKTLAGEVSVLYHQIKIILDSIAAVYNLLIVA